MNENTKSILGHIIIKMAQENADLINVVRMSSQRTESAATVSTVDPSLFNPESDCVGVALESVDDDAHIGVDPITHSGRSARDFVRTRYPHAVCEHSGARFVIVGASEKNEVLYYDTPGQAWRAEEKLRREADALILKADQGTSAESGPVTVDHLYERAKSVTQAIQFVDQYHPSSYSFCETIGGQLVHEIRIEDGTAISNTFPTMEDAWLSAAEMLRKGLKPTHRERGKEVLDRQDQIREKPRANRDESPTEPGLEKLVDEMKQAINATPIPGLEEMEENKAYVLSVYPDATIQTWDKGGWVVEAGEVAYDGLFEYQAWQEAADTIRRNVALAKKYLQSECQWVKTQINPVEAITAHVSNDIGCFIQSGIHDRSWIELHTSVRREIEKQTKAADVPCEDELWVKSIYPDSTCGVNEHGWGVAMNGMMYYASDAKQAWAKARYYAENDINAAKEFVRQNSETQIMYTVFQRSEPARYQVTARSPYLYESSGQYESEDAAWLDLAKELRNDE